MLLFGKQSLQDGGTTDAIYMLVVEPKRPE